MDLFLIIGGIALVVWYISSRGEKNEQSGAGKVSMEPRPSRGRKPSEPSKASAVKTSPQKAPRVVRSQHEPFAFCALDTETTGIVPRSRRHRAFEISAVVFTPTGEGRKYKKKRLTRFVRVDTRGMKGLKLSPMWEEHYLSGGQREAIEISDALNDLRDFAKDLPLVCHNASFDRCVIENEIEKCNHGWMPSNRWICTLRMARSSRNGKFVGYSPGRADGFSYKLEHVAKALNIPFDPNQLHFGHYDAEVAGTVFLRMYHGSVPISYES